MKKDSVQIGQDQTTGIRVIIQKHKNTYDVELFIPKGTFYESSKITISNKQFALQATVPEENMSRQISYCIHFNRGYQIVRHGLIKNARATIKFEVDGCSGTINLNPKFYIPSTRRATPKKLKKAEQLQRNTITITHERPSASRYAPYKHTNIARPYSGGKVSPK